MLNGRLESGEIPPIVNSWLAGEEGEKEEENYVEDHHQHISCSSTLALCSLAAVALTGARPGLLSSTIITRSDWFFGLSYFCPELQNFPEFCSVKYREALCSISNSVFESSPSVAVVFFICSICLHQVTTRATSQAGLDEPVLQTAGTTQAAKIEKLIRSSTSSNNSYEL